MGYADLDSPIRPPGTYAKFAHPLATPPRKLLHRMISVHPMMTSEPEFGFILKKRMLKMHLIYLCLGMCIFKMILSRLYIGPSI